VAWDTSWSNGQAKGESFDARRTKEGHASVPKVIYVGLNGQEYNVDVPDGESVMAAAVKNGVPGIIGECGGNASCATCHVFVRDEFVALVGEPNPTEEDLLEMGVSDRREGSRLSCQIKMNGELDGLTVDIAPQEM
jgi:ferredoxin, 2Fe-2S